MEIYIYKAYTSSIASTGYLRTKNAICDLRTKIAVKGNIVQIGRKENYLSFYPLLAAIFLARGDTSFVRKNTTLSAILDI